MSQAGAIPPARTRLLRRGPCLPCAHLASHLGLSLDHALDVAAGKGALHVAAVDGVAPPLLVAADCGQQGTQCRAPQAGSNDETQRVYMPQNGVPCGAGIAPGYTVDKTSPTPQAATAGPAQWGNQFRGYSFQLWAGAPAMASSMSSTAGRSSYCTCTALAAARACASVSAATMAMACPTHTTLSCRPANAGGRPPALQEVGGA
jgi:hypothetical protein